MTHGLSFQKTTGLYWPLSTLIPCQNIVTYTEMLSYNIDWARESKSRDLSQNCTLIHEFKKEKERKLASPTEVL